MSDSCARTGPSMREAENDRDFWCESCASAEPRQWKSFEAAALSSDPTEEEDGVGLLCACLRGNFCLKRIEDEVGDDEADEVEESFLVACFRGIFGLKATQ